MTASTPTALLAKYPDSTHSERYFCELCLGVMADELEEASAFDSDRFMAAMGNKYGPTVERMLRKEYADRSARSAAS